MVEKKFWAKSDFKETIQEHTDNVLKEYERLRRIYPKCKVNWQLLEQACLYHDLGKMNLKFQRKIKNNLGEANLNFHTITRNAEKIEGEVPHGILSTLFLDAKKLKNDFQGSIDFEKFDNLNDAISILFSAIYYHHDREIFEKDEFKENLLTNVNREKNLLKDIIKDFRYDKVSMPEHLNLRHKYIRRFSNADEGDLLREYVLLKGCLNRVDYAASAHIPVEFENDFLESKLNCFIKKLQDKAICKDKENPEWNALQKFMKNNQNKNVVAIAQTGMGKTEAGLWWIGNNKGFFTLPVRTAINAMYRRIKEDILDNEAIDSRIGLLHSETQGIYFQLQEENNDCLNIANYFTVTKQLSLPLIICTIDQLFTTVFRYRGYEPKLATLSYSNIVIDEIQMYTPEIIGFLICGLMMVTELGGNFAIMTATFPGFLKEIMENCGLKFRIPHPFVDERKIRHSVEWHKEDITCEFILDKYNHNKILVVCNTVKRCQKIYKELSDKINFQANCSDDHKLIDDFELNMLHGKYIYTDRIAKEKAILAFGKTEKTGVGCMRKGIWITSSIAEASLDVDFDVLITELSDVNGLFQRMGRCYRKRNWTGDGANCYIFDGGEGRCSGVGYNIDEEIFYLSKRKLRRYFKGHSNFLKEIDKMDLVSSIYSKENIKGLNYYATIKKCVNEPKLYLPSEKEKAEAQRLFRNILTETIIPSEVFDENKKEIENLASSLNESLKIEEKIKIQEKLKAFTVNIEKYQLEKASVKKKIKINKYEEIKIIDAEYDSDMGLMNIVKKNKEIESNII